MRLPIFPLVHQRKAGTDKAACDESGSGTRFALQNVASIVSLMLTTKVLIVDAKGEEKMAAAAAGYGGAY